MSASDRGAGLLSRSLPLRVWRDSSPGGADDRVVRVAVGTRVGRLISYRERSAQERLEVRLARASRITGRVTGPHEGVVGARVSAHGEGVDGIAVWALVREGGTFELTGVPHGERVTLSVSLEPGWRAESPAYATGGDSDLEIRVVSRGETIRGTLLDARGGPAVGKLISARRARHLLAEPSPPVVVDTDGRFELPCSPGVASELVVDGLVLGVASAGDDVVVRFPECHLLRGKVHTATGLPIVGTAWIESTDPAWPFSAQVIDGAFEVPAVPAGERSIMLIVYAPPSSEIVDALRKDGREDAIARWRGGASTHLEARTLTIPCGDIEFVITEKKKR